MENGYFLWVYKGSLQEMSEIYYVKHYFSTQNYKGKPRQAADFPLVESVDFYVNKLKKKLLSTGMYRKNDTDP